jgi:hypothetical protein
MKYGRSILRTVELVVLFSSIRLAFAADRSVPQPVASLNIAELRLNQKDPSLVTVAFSSDTTIEVVACTTVRRDTTCPSAIFRWDNALLEFVAREQTSDTSGRSSSADGKRMLVDFNDRAVSRRQHLFDEVRAFYTFGMIYPEEVNREVVRVVDSATRRSCFDWYRIFPMTGVRRRSAAILASGEFVAIYLENILSVYRLPSMCEGARVSRRGMHIQRIRCGARLVRGRGSVREFQYGSAGAVTVPVDRCSSFVRSITHCGKTGPSGGILPCVIAQWEIQSVPPSPT